MCKYESELHLSDTIVDGDDSFDMTGRDCQDHTVMNVRKTRRRLKTRKISKANNDPDTLETRCENSTASNRTPKKKKPVTLKKTQTNVVSKRNLIKDFFCPQCSNSYFHACSLGRHLKYECGKACKFGCPYCEQKSKLRECARRHIIRCHKGQPVYINELY